MVDEHKISNLTDYLNIIEQKSGDFYFRGEKEDYEETRNTAGIYRNCEGRYLYPMKEILLRKKYFEEIGYKLNTNDTKNFISFAQHHGLKTELLDITENSLVALWMACQTSDNGAGYVYLINQEKTIPLDKHLINDNVELQYFQINEHIKRLEEHIFTPRTEWNKWVEDIMDKKLTDIHQCFTDKSIDDLEKYIVRMFGLLGSQLLYLGNIPDQIKKGVDNAIKSKNFDLLYTNVKKFYDTNGGVFNEEQNFENFKHDFLSWLSIKLYHNTFSDTLVKKELEFPIKKYFVHQPSVTFDRIRNQHGKFIYQFTINGHPQQIVPDYTLMIPKEDKSKIIEQLDKIGINQKYIYDDFDNIAQYVNQKNYITDLEKRMKNKL